jgi:hypothetical protein
VFGFLLLQETAARAPGKGRRFNCGPAGKKNKKTAKSGENRNSLEIERSCRWPPMISSIIIRISHTNNDGD